MTHDFINIEKIISSIFFKPLPILNPLIKQLFPKKSKRSDTIKVD